MAPERVSARGPGRVNLIGEHTDYNQGFCLPFAVEAGVTVRAERAEGHRVEARALDLDEADSFDPARPGGPGEAGGWRALVRGTVAELRPLGVTVRGARLEIEGDLPRGAGLASSAALGSALCLALPALAGRPELDRRELARLCSRVENEWVGAHTGLLDQMASLLGREGEALLLDCRDLTTRPVPLELGGWTICVAASGSTRSHSESGYNERRRECAEACRLLGLQSLRDAGEEAAGSLPEPLQRRVRHVVSENARVGRAAGALRAGELTSLAALVDASHASLRDDYEVSVPEVELEVKRMKAAGAAGARIMGGGFGGSVLALFPPGVDPPGSVLVVTPAAGARLL